MSYGSFGGGSYLSATFGATYDTALTIVVWVKRTAAQWADTSNDFVIHFGDDFTDNLDSIGIIAGGAADQVGVTAADAVSQDIGALAFTGGAYDDTWVPIIAVYNAANDRDIYIESSSNSITDTTSKDEGSALDSLTVGARLDDSNPFAGLIAEVAIFSAAWDTTKVDQVQTSAETGPAPNTIDATNCIAYWSLNSNKATHADESGNGGPNLAENGVVAFNADHPTITASGSKGRYYYAQQ